MSLVALGGMPIVPVGAAGTNLTPKTVGHQSSLIDAANEACIMVGYVVTEDGASHTIDTTGSSSLGWRSVALTFANAGTTVKVGLAAVDTTTGPPARAVNVANVITFDVSKSLTGGGGGITANAWQEHVPDAGTKTINNGDLLAFAIQATARAGVDAVNVGCVLSIMSDGLPTVTEYTSGTYSAPQKLPNAVITFSDGALGFFYGSYVSNVGATTQTWNNSSGTKEYGNFLQFPVPVNVYGIYCYAGFGGDCDVVLYSDPLGTPVAQKTVSIDLNVMGNSSTAEHFISFASPFSLAANTPYAAILKPSSATNVSLLYKTFNASAHQKSDVLGTNCYAINRNTGAFAAQNSSKDRYSVGLLVGAFDSGGGGGISRARAAAGF